MRLVARRFGVWGMVLAGGIVMGAPAYGAISLAVALKNNYAAYEIVAQCARQAQLTPEDVETAGTALAAIEAHYLGRDGGLDKAQLKRLAIEDKNDSFRILERSGASSFRPYCQMSLNELLRKAQEVGAPAGGRQ